MNKLKLKQIKCLFQGQKSNTGKIQGLNPSFLLLAWTSFQYIHSTFHKYVASNYCAQAYAISTRRAPDPVFMKRMPLYLCFGTIPLSAEQKLGFKGGGTVAAAQVGDHGGLH